MIKRQPHRTALLAALLSLAAAGAVATPAGMALAQPVAATAADKALVDAAKARGEVGEQSDGYLGFVKGSPGDPALAAAVASINAGRAAAFREAAAKTGVTAEAAGVAAAKLLVGRVPPGQAYRDANGTWVRK